MTYLIDLRLVDDPTPSSPLVQALFFSGSTDAARSVLAAIAGAWTTIMGVVFSITMVVLQLASSKYTSQLIPRFEQDRITQATLLAADADGQAAREGRPRSDALVPEGTPREGLTAL